MVRLKNYELSDEQLFLIEDIKLEKEKLHFIKKRILIEAETLNEWKRRARNSEEIITNLAKLLNSLAK